MNCASTGCKKHEHHGTQGSTLTVDMPCWKPGQLGEQQKDLLIFHREDDSTGCSLTAGHPWAVRSGMVHAWVACANYAPCQSCEKCDPIRPLPEWAADKWAVVRKWDPEDSRVTIGTVTHVGVPGHFRV